MNSEVVVRRYSSKQVSLKIWQISQKTLVKACNFIKKRPKQRMLSCESCEIFYRTPWVTASVNMHLRSLWKSGHKLFPWERGQILEELIYTPYFWMN